MISYFLANLTGPLTKPNKAYLISSITIEDPEQRVIRISDLTMNTNYTLFIWARTASGRGQPAFFYFRTALQSQCKSICIKIK